MPDREEKKMWEVIYEDSDVIVVKKPAGMESQSSRGFEADMVSEIKNYLKRSQKTEKIPYVGVIHRLDKPVSGLLVYAKTPQAAKNLSAQIQNGMIKKQYLAVLCGKPENLADNYVNYLLKDGKNNLSRIVDKGIKDAKRAELSYHVLDTLEDERGCFSLVEIALLTGRHHQIRVQFSGHGTPLFGDNKYGGEGKGLALSACQLSFLHPKTKKQMLFRERPEGQGFEPFSETLKRIF